MFHLQLGTVPDWVAGLALPLAVLAIVRDHEDRRRGQVAQVGAWCDEVTYNKDHGEFRTILHIRNGSHFPVAVYIIAYQISVLGPPPTPGSSQGQDNAREVSSSSAWVVGTIAPGEDWTRETGYSLEQLGLSATTVERGYSAEATITQLVVTDNAGRTWNVRPHSARTSRHWHRYRPQPDAPRN
jgi:hypothetical protein